MERIISTIRVGNESIRFIHGDHGVTVSTPRLWLRRRQVRFLLVTPHVMGWIPVGTYDAVPNVG